MEQKKNEHLTTERKTKPEIQNRITSHRWAHRKTSFSDFIFLAHLGSIRFLRPLCVLFVHATLHINSFLFQSIYFSAAFFRCYGSLPVCIYTFIHFHTFVFNLLGTACASMCPSTIQCAPSFLLFPFASC